MFKKVLIDFMTDENCAFCESGRTLKEGVRLINLVTRSMVVCSKHCLDKESLQIINASETIPDVTRGIIQQNLNGKAYPSGNSNKEKESALEYLILRQDKLSEIEGIPYNGINDIYQEFEEDHSLSLSALNRLNKFIQTTTIRFPEYSLRNLQKLYASVFWLQYARDKADNLKTKEFLESVLKHYKRKKFISIKQDTAIKKTFKSLNLRFDKKSDRIPNVQYHVS